MMGRFVRSKRDFVFFWGGGLVEVCCDGFWILCVCVFVMCVIEKVLLDL